METRRVFKISASRCASRLWFSSILLLNIRSVDSCNPIFCLVVLCVLFLNVGSLFSPCLSRFVCVVLFMDEMEYGFQLTRLRQEKVNSELL